MKVVSSSACKSVIKPQWIQPVDLKKDLRFTRQQKTLMGGIINKNLQHNYYPLAADVLIFADFLFDTMLRCQVEIKTSFIKNQSVDLVYKEFRELPCIRPIISPTSLHKSFAMLAKLPTDAISSVTALYEALHYISSKICPVVTWKFEVLLTGFLLPNIKGRAFHTYAIQLTLTNFARLVLCRRYP